MQSPISKVMDAIETRPTGRVGHLLTSWPVVCTAVSAIFLGIVYVFGNFGSSHPPDLWNPEFIRQVKKITAPAAAKSVQAAAIPGQKQ